MELSTWELGTIFTHLFSYFGMCALVGGGFVRLMCKQSIKLDLEFRQLIMIVCGCAFITTAAGFFIHVGAFSESGFIGMWDAEVISILWDSEIGDSTLVRLLGFAVGFFVFHFNFSIGGKNDNKKSLSLLGVLLYLLGMVLVARSFSLTGHTSEMTIAGQIMLSVHVIAATWWMGALWPLWRACQVLKPEPLQKLMHDFGQYALLFLALLLCCGGVLGYRFYNESDGIFLSGYGQLFIFKILIVTVILLLATRNKYFLVPHLLGSTRQSKALVNGIKLEMIFGLMILVTTTVIATLLGPGH